MVLVLAVLVWIFSGLGFEAPRFLDVLDGLALFSAIQPCFEGFCVEVCGGLAFHVG